MAFNQLDIYIFGFILIMAILGYKKGFITRLYDMISLIIVVYLSYILSNPLSAYFSISELGINDPTSLLISQCINQIGAFVVIFVVLFIIKKIVGVLIKPLLNKIIKIFSLTSFVNHVLGLFLSIIEGFVLAYIAIILLMTPIYAQGYELVEQSIIAKTMLEYAPAFTNEIEDLSRSLTHLSQEHNSDKDVINLMLIAYDYHLINDEQVSILINNYLYEDMQKQTLSFKQYELLNDMLNSSYCEDKVKKSILKKVNVSDE